MSKTYLPVLTIAGSDSGGCAGIQADIKSISANGGFAASVITATTAQNTQGVADIHAIPIDHLAAQMDAVFQDIHFASVKIGMLHSAAVIDCVANKLHQYQAQNLVLDPVMVATSGDRLITDDAIHRLAEFIPQTRLITPNLAEASILIDEQISHETQGQAAQQLAEKFSTSVLIKGKRDHQGMITDTLYCCESKNTQLFSHPYIDTQHTHGTGCSLSSAIATHLALGTDLTNAVNKAIDYVHKAIKAGRDKQLGQGCGPIDHFFSR